jgi:hypothetical protein
VKRYQYATSDEVLAHINGFNYGWLKGFCWGFGISFFPLAGFIFWLLLFSPLAMK